MHKHVRVIHVCLCVYIYIYIYTHTLLLSLRQAAANFCPTEPAWLKSARRIL